MLPDISIVVCTYNRCERLQRFLQSMEAVPDVPLPVWELIIVDNNSSDDTRQVVEACARRWTARVVYLFEPRQGKSYALNAGIAAARGGIVACTDDDVTVHPQWLSGLWQTFLAYDCPAVGGKIVPVFEAAIPRWLALYPSYPFLNALVSFDFGTVPCALRHPPFGANMAFRKEVFARYGLFRTDLGPADGNPMGKGEDSEFASRLLRDGKTIMYAPGAVIFHPVERERLKRAYFSSWYYNYGRSEMVRSTVPAGTVRYFGIPRFLYRRLIAAFAAWVLDVSPRRRLRKKLEFCRAAGEFVQSLRQGNGNTVRRAAGGAAPSGTSET